MTRLFVHPAAEADLQDAFDWYEKRRAGLGFEFLESVRAALQGIEDAPQRHPFVHRDVRRLLLRRFPYGLFYREEADRLLLVACMHARRDPLRWQGRGG